MGLTLKQWTTGISSNRGWTPQSLQDGNTVAWYDYTTGITKDGSNFISQWDDQSGNDNHLINTSLPLRQPELLSTGVYFAGLVGGRGFLKTSDFGLTQPEFIYIVLRRLSESGNGIILDGLTIQTGMLIIERATGKTTIVADSSIGSPIVPLNTWAIIRALINDDDSLIQIDRDIAAEGDVGVKTPGGITLGGRGADGNQGNCFEVKELIVRKSADDLSTQELFYKYLEKKHGIA